MNKGIVVGGGLAVLVIVGIVGGMWYMNKNAATGSTMPATNTTPATTGSDNKMIPSPTGGAEAMMEDAGTGNVVELTVTSTGLKFAPTELKVKKGDTVRITYKNTGGIHDFVIDEFDVATNQIGDGEEEEVEFVASKTGSFEFYCSVTNHRAMGMKGTLIVE